MYPQKSDFCNKTQKEMFVRKFKTPEKEMAYQPLLATAMKPQTKIDRFFGFSKIVVTVIWFTGSYTRLTLHHLARVSANWHRTQHLPFRPLAGVLLQPVFHSAWSSLCPVSEPRYPTPNKYPRPLPQTLVIKNLSLDLLLWTFRRVGLVPCAVCTCSIGGRGCQGIFTPQSVSCLTPFAHRRARPSTRGHLVVHQPPRLLQTFLLLSLSALLL